MNPGIDMIICDVPKVNDPRMYYIHMETKKKFEIYYVAFDILR